MRGNFNRWWLINGNGLVVAFFTDDPDGVIAVIPLLHSPFAGFVETFMPCPCGKAQHTLAGFIGLFRVLAAFYNAGNIITTGLAYFFGTLQELIQVPVGLVAVLASQVVLVGGVIKGSTITVIQSNAIMLVE